MVTAQRFAKGLTFDQYVAMVGTPENLAREGSSAAGPAPRRDWSGYLKARYGTARLTDAQTAAIRWLAAQPGGPAKILVIAEEWSSDVRRDLPSLQRLADAGGMELRIFTRDGRNLPKDGRPDPATSPNADLMLHYINRKDGGEFASIPIAAFFDRDFRELYRYVEFPAIFHKARVMGKVRAARPGETPEQTKERGMRDFMAVLESPFYDVWADAAVDEIISALHERQVLGA